jgi:predicted nucleic acid-binding protein
MKVFIDTSVLVSTVIQQHESDSRALSVLERVQSEKDEGFISGHSLAETYAVLSDLWLRKCSVFSINQIR